MLKLRFIGVNSFTVCLLVLHCTTAVAFGPSEKKAQRDDAIGKIPMSRLTASARQRVQKIVSHPTMFRRLPSQSMACAPDMFLFLVRHPEVLVGIWDVMDITKVHMKRTGPFNIVADDGQGTTCEIELVYGDSSIHLYHARGKYDGPMVAKPITGSGVFVLHSGYVRGSSNNTSIEGQMDVFLQLDSLGADLVVRTLGPLIGKSADHNFVETAKFITQVSQASEVNPSGVRRLAQKLPQVTEPVRAKFIATAMKVSEASMARSLSAASGLAPRTSLARVGETENIEKPRTSEREATALKPSPFIARVPTPELDPMKVAVSPATPTASAQAAPVAVARPDGADDEITKAEVEAVLATRSPIRPRKGKMNLRR